MSGTDEIDPNAKPPVEIGGSESAPAIAAADAIESGGSVEGTAATAITQNRAIAEGLASGALDPVAAQHLLIDQVLAEQLGSDLAPEQLDRLRVELAELLEADPILAALLRP